MRNRPHGATVAALVCIAAGLIPALSVTSAAASTPRAASSGSISIEQTTSGTITAAQALGEDICNPAQKP